MTPMRLSTFFFGSFLSGGTGYGGRAGMDPFSRPERLRDQRGGDHPRHLERTGLSMACRAAGNRI